MEEELKYIIESLLFVSETPLPMDRLKKVLEEFETKEIKEALEALVVEYDARGGGFMLKEVAGGYQIRTRPGYAQYIKRLIQPGAQRLSKAALETLAIIAYKQPVIRADIEFIRGVDCGGVLRMLLEKKLVRVLGRKEIPGRPMIYATTKQFLEIFDLKDLKDLPSPKEIEALGETHILDLEADDGQETENHEFGKSSENESESLENRSDAPVSDNTKIIESGESESESKSPEPIEDDPLNVTEDTPIPNDEASPHTLAAASEGLEGNDETYSREEIHVADSQQDLDAAELNADLPIEIQRSDLDPDREDEGDLPEHVNSGTDKPTDTEDPEDHDSDDDKPTNLEDEPPEKRE